MDKNKIKAHLSKRFLSEETTPGISVTDKVKKASEKINKAGVKDMEKDSLAYNKSLKQDKDTSKMATNKYNYTNDSEKQYHDEMEILNGQEMIKYTSEPGQEFKDRAEESIEGSSRMGNKGGKGMGNAEATWGASSDDFGKELIKRIRNSETKRNKADASIDDLTMLGDKIAYPNDKVTVKPNTTAVGSDSKRSNKNDTSPAKKSATPEKSNAKTVKENNNNNLQIKESMKRLKFNKDGDKPFKGVNLTQKLGHALTLIPESYRVDSKEFEMTDGNVSCRVRWEGTLTEGKAIILVASDKTLINEDMNRMKALMGYKSEETLGLVKGNARIDENKVFGDIWNKTKKLLGEEEDIEDADVVDGSAESLDTVVGHAPEAKKHVEGSVPTEKKTNAPEPKKGSADSIDKVKSQAPEAKKHVEGSVAEDKKTNAPAPKEGEWEEIKKKAPEASKDIESGKSTNKATDKAKVVKENEEVGDDNEDEATASSKDAAFNAKADKEDSMVDDEDDSTEEKEPSAKDIKSEVPPIDDVAPIPAASKSSATILFSPSTGEYWLKKGDASTKVPDEYLSVAADKTKKGAERAAIILAAMQEKADSPEGGEAELDEYGDEHPVATADAVSSMKPGQEQPQAH